MDLGAFKPLERITPPPAGSKHPEADDPEMLESIAVEYQPPQYSRPTAASRGKVANGEPPPRPTWTMVNPTLTIT